MTPWQQVTLVLSEAKREGLEWERAWYSAIRTLSPEHTSECSPFVRRTLEEDRALLRECKPWLRAAYEDREVTAEEFLRSEEEAQKRLDSLMALA